MPKFVGKFYLSYDGHDIPRNELIGWLTEAGILDFDTEGCGELSGVDGVACLIDWESIEETT
jgi:hypothetical protein